MNAKFYIMFRFGKKEQRAQCSVMAEKKQQWNLKYQIQDPIILHVYQLNIVKVWDRLKFWIQGSTLATISSNNWSRSKSPTTKILCCVGSSRGPDIRYTMTNKKSPFLFLFLLGISIISIPNSQVFKEKLHSDK